jgi:DeoR family fructose operon transcriptional repressor
MTETRSQMVNLTGLNIKGLGTQKVHIRSTIAAEDRLAWMREQLATSGRIEITEAAAALDVSEMTIRRDLQELEALGYARRLRGGAVPVGPTPLADRRRRDAAAKARIAAKLLPLIPEAGAVGFDASSTLLRLANAIDGSRDLTIVTNSTDTFHALQHKPGIRPVLTGGELDSRTDSLVGPVAERAAGEILQERFIMSAAALDPELGASEACVEEAEVKRAFAASAKEVVLAAASSKLGTRAVARSLPWDRVALLVTELDPTDPRLKPYHANARLL